MSTNIEWTDETWNPLTGCGYVSPGCLNCYAARDTAGRLRNHPAHKGLAVRSHGFPARFEGEIRLLPDRLDQPRRWKKPRRIFVNSMSDLFHPDVPINYVAEVWAAMLATPRHTYQVLTKRPQILAHRLGVWLDVDAQPGIWLGTSIELDEYAFRADRLRDAPAALRFLSLEPLLGPLPSLSLTDIDWVIVGAESGPAARPMQLEWVRDIRDRCQAAGVPLFVKQLTNPKGRVYKDISEFPPDLRIREMPDA